MWEAARWRAWTARLALDLRRWGARLVLDAPFGAHFDGAPKLKLEGAGGGSLTLRVGRGVELGRHLTVELWSQSDNVLELGDGVVFSANVRLQLRGGTIRLGRGVQVRDASTLKAQGELIAGEQVVIGQSDVLSCTERIELGDLVGLGERVSITDSDHGADGSDAHYLYQPLSVAPVVLDRNVLVSAGAVILRGSRVGRNAVIGAGAVVTGGELPAGWLVAGVPARPIKALQRHGR